MAIKAVSLKAVHAFTNFMLFGIGMAGVWMSTHSWIGILFAFVASIHVSHPSEETNREG